MEGKKEGGSAIMYRMKNNRLALEALPQASTQQTLFFSVLHKMALPEGKLEAKLEIARQLLDVLDVETIAQKTRRRLRLYDRRLTDD